MLSPILRAFSQLDDPAFVGVLWRSVLLSVVTFLAITAGSVWAVATVLNQPGWIGWLAGLAGGIGAALLAFWLFVPAAILIATLYSNRVAAAVDHRFYPGLSDPSPAAITAQAWDGVALGAQILGFQVVALIVAILVPGIGVLLGWAITGWAIGRGLFVTVAMRRMSRVDALRLYASRRWPVLLQGGLLALATTIPLLNLLVPVLGVAALTHVLNDDRPRRRIVSA